MVRVLIIDDDSEVRELVTTVLESKMAGVQVMEADSPDRAVGLMSRTSDFSLILCDNTMPGGNAEIVFSQAKKSHDKTPFILMMEENDQVSINPDATLLKPFKMKDVYDLVQKTLSEGSKKKTDIGEFISQPSTPAMVNPATTAMVNPVSELAPISTLVAPLRHHESDSSSFISGPFAEVPVGILSQIDYSGESLYLKLGEGRYICVGGRKSKISNIDFDRRVIPNVGMLAVEASLSDRIIGVLADRLIAKSKESVLSLDESIGFLIQCNRVIRGAVQSFGLTLSVLKAIQGAVRVSVKLSESHGVSAIAQVLPVDRSFSYVSNHAVGVSLLAPLLARELNLSQDKALYKLALAAFFHDMTLDDMTYDMYRMKVQSSMLNAENGDADAFLNHPITAARLISGIQGMLPDVSRIALEHHERPEGKGFPSKISGASMHPLSVVFIIAHELMDAFNEMGAGASTEAVIQNIRTLAIDTRFKMLIDGFQQCINK